MRETRELAGIDLVIFVAMLLGLVGALGAIGDHLVAAIDRAGERAAHARCVCAAPR